MGYQMRLPCIWHGAYIIETETESTTCTSIPLFFFPFLLFCIAPVSLYSSLHLVLRLIEGRVLVRSVYLLVW